MFYINLTDHYRCYIVVIFSGCTLFPTSGHFCPDGYPRPSTQYYYNPYSQKCEAFYFRGCGDTPNKFSTKAACLRGCACFSDIDFGNNCPNNPFNYVIRYAFDQFSGTCQQFHFSACNGGNDNNFRSQLECQNTCGPTTDSSFPINRIPIGRLNEEITFTPPSNSIVRPQSNTPTMNVRPQGNMVSLNLQPRGNMAPLNLQPQGNMVPLNIQPQGNMASINVQPRDSMAPLDVQQQGNMARANMLRQDNLAPLNMAPGSQMNFGSSSIMAIEGLSPSFRKRTMKSPASEFNFGSSSITAGNSPVNGRRNRMPSPVNMLMSSIMNTARTASSETGNGMTRGVNNKVYK